MLAIMGQSMKKDLMRGYVGVSSRRVVGHGGPKCGGVLVLADQYLESE